MIPCIKCSCILTDKNWYSSSQKKRDYICIECQKKKSSYKNNINRYKRNKIARQNWVTNEKRKTGCEICGYNTNPAALEFHHIDSSKKSFQMGASQSIAANKRERKKCLVLCANCHREIHNIDVLSQQ